MRVDRNERVLVTTLTKKMSEDLTDYLLEMGFKVRYLHSEVDTLERIQIIRDLRLGEYDVLVGVNLLREGLDLPEVSLVAILDADKEGFLRGETSLIQTIGRAARNVDGTVLMYADKETAAMRGGDRRDRPPPRDPARLQRGARHHGRLDRQGRQRHRRVPPGRGQDAQGPAPQRAQAVKTDDDAADRAREDDRRARGGDARRRRGPALRVRRAAARRDPRPAARARRGADVERPRGGARRPRAASGGRRCTTRCSTGTPRERATCRGGARATPTRSSSARSCSSRRRSRASSRATRPGSSAGRPRGARGAPRADVLRAWVGLGYNRRALRLREACAQSSRATAGRGRRRPARAARHRAVHRGGGRRRSRSASRWPGRHERAPRRRRARARRRRAARRPAGRPTGTRR